MKDCVWYEQHTERFFHDAEIENFLHHGQLLHFPIFLFVEIY